MPRISVIMPVYNTDETYLRDAIGSILSQSFYDFEFLILNDGSTNDAKEVIKSYNDQRIKYIENRKNLGLIATLNKGLKLANGEYIARMDSDDISHTDRFKKQVEFLDNNSTIGVLGTWYQKFGNREQQICPFVSSYAIKMQMILGQSAICHPSVMFRASLNAKYNSKWLHSEDYALWLDLINKTEFANLDEFLLYYRWHNNNICRNNSLKQAINSQLLMTMAQSKYFSLDCKSVLKIIAKLADKQKITSDELYAMNEFILRMNTLAKKELSENTQNLEINKIEIAPSRFFYKYALKQTKKDIKFYSILFGNDVDKIIKLSFGTKLLHLFTL